MKLPRWMRWRTARELDEELQAHLEMEVQDHIDRGLTPEEARYAALRALGSVTGIKEVAREGDPLFRFEMLARDLRYAVRNLARNRGFTFAAILSLALGIGANTAIFSFVDGLLLRPMEVPRHNEIVRAFTATPQSRFDEFSYREYTAYRDRNRTLSGLLAEIEAPVSFKASPDELPRNTLGVFASGNFFSVLQVTPFLGRTLQPEDDSPGAREIGVMLAYKSWDRRFHGDRNLVGSQVRINGQPAVVVGILPRGFSGTEQTDRPEIFVPLAAISRLFPNDSTTLTDPQRRPLHVYGRLKPGVSAQTAQADFTTVASALQNAYPDTNRLRTGTVLGELAWRLQADSENALLLILLMGVVGIVLLIACTNVANLLLGRASARTREIAIRLSVGASRGRLIVQLLTESAVLATAGAAAGLLLAVWAVDFFTSIRLPSDFPLELPMRIDARVLAYTLGVMVFSVILFGLWPAWRATRVDLAAPLKRGSGGRSRSGGRQMLVVTQTALSALLLVASALFTENFVRSSMASPGFRIDHVLLATLDPVAAGYSVTRTRVFYGNLEETVRALPGVRSAALSSHVQTTWVNTSQPIARAGTDLTDPKNLTSVMYNIVTPAFFTTIDIPVLRGRAVDGRDTLDAPRVAVVNETMARNWWPDGNAIGQRIALIQTGGIAEVVGIARDAKYEDLNEAPQPYVYLAYAQQVQSRMTLMVHTAGDPQALVPALRGELKALAPEVPVSDFRSMREVFEGAALLLPRLIAELVGALGAIGFSLAVVGLYAVVAFVVSRRTREIGIRMALGATPQIVLRSVLAAGVKTTLCGVALGLAGAFAVAGFFAAFLDRVNPHDPATFAGAAVLLLCVALAACWVPARRAARVNPVETLREE